MSAFDDGRDVCDIFDFGESVPQWAEQRSEIISIEWKSGELEFHPFNYAAGIGALSAIGTKTKRVEDTLAWLENPETLLCFPDTMMGPDIILFIDVAEGCAEECGRFRIVNFTNGFHVPR